MSKLPAATMLTIVHLDRAAAAPLHRQLYDALRRAILAGQLEPGIRLPSSRDLARQLGISRNTVLNAVDQLLAEGYLETRPGAGTYVSADLPERLLQAALSPAADDDAAAGPRTISRRGRAFARAFAQQHPRPPHSPALLPGGPALDLFPFDLWARLTGRFYRSVDPATLGYNQSAAGYPPLQEAIATYVRTARAVRCRPDQIIITTGSQQALFLAAQVLLDNGDTIGFEDPGYGGAAAAFLTNGLRLVPLPVDADGLQVDALPRLAPAARAVCTTPSHQYPLGGTLSLARRLALLDWARRQNAWIIEDDYDSAFRYSGPPLASLQGLDRDRRVVYVGSFSKLLFPALRLGFLVVPRDLRAPFLTAKGAAVVQTNLADQAVLAAFIGGGHLTRHVRRMRVVYARRRTALLDALAEYLPQRLTPGPADAGMHMVGFLAPGQDDEAIAAAALQQGVGVMPLSRLYRSTPRPGFVFGFTRGTPAEIRDAVAGLARVIPHRRALPDS